MNNRDPNEAKRSHISTRVSRCTKGLRLFLVTSNNRRSLCLAKIDREYTKIITTGKLTTRSESDKLPFNITPSKKLLLQTNGAIWETIHKTPRIPENK